MTRISASSGISNPTIGELKAFLARIPASADNNHLRISVTQDRPFEGEHVSIQATWEEELQEPFDPDKHNAVGITGLDIIEAAEKKLAAIERHMQKVEDSR